MKRLKERYVGQSENGGDQIENHENFVAVYTIAKMTVVQNGGRLV